MELKNSKYYPKITKIEPDSIADELGLEIGDMILSINGEEIEDIIQYEYLIATENLELKIYTKDDELIYCDIEKHIDEPLGLEFDSPILSSIKTCSNNCLFCFVDQLPSGMRKTLYIKDDDSRLSFLQGNFITLTNMKESDIQKIIDYNISPINISVHTTDEELRCKILGNRFAGGINSILKRFKDGGISMNAQIVLMKNINDGKNLDKTINNLYELRPQMKQVAIVPVGITKYRQNLPHLEIFSPEDSRKVINQVEAFQNRFLKECGSRFVFLSDEFYVNGEERLPSDEEYEGYLQFENGVGMVRRHYEEFKKELDLVDREGTGTLAKNKVVSIATGELAYDYICHISQILEKKFPNLNIKVYKIINDFFGSTITVTGLLTGRDLVSQLQDKELGSNLLISQTMLKEGEDIFLDDYTLGDIRQRLNVEVTPSKNTGKDFIRDILG